MEWKRSVLALAVAALIGVGTGCNAIPGLGGGDDNNSDNRSSGTLSDIPRDARVVREGRSDFDWEANADGRVYLYDTTNRELKYNAPIRDGQRIAFDTEKDRVDVDGRRVKSLSMDDNATYRIYFLADSASRSDRNNDRDNDRTPSAGAGRVPDTARVVSQGRNRDLSFEADSDGTAYLWDDTDSQLVNTFNLDRGQSLAVSPSGDKVALNGRIIVKDMNLSRQHTYKLLFDRHR